MGGEKEDVRDGEEGGEEGGKEGGRERGRNYTNTSIW